jgi:hypothetical protein
MYEQVYIKSKYSSEGKNLWIRLFSGYYGHPQPIASTCLYNA